MRRVRTWLEDTRTPVGIQFLSICLAGIIVSGLGISALVIMGDRSRTALDNSRAALYATRMSAAATSARLTANGEIVSAAPSVQEVISAYEELEHARRDVEALHLLVGSARTLEAYGAVTDAQDALLAYATSGGQEEYDLFQGRLQTLGDISNQIVPLLTAEAEAEEARLKDLERAALAATIIATVVGGLAVGSISLYIGRRLTSVLRQLRVENAALAEAKKAVERRNGQFQALHHVMSEVSETLSMKYVVQTTLREARRLVSAEAVILRLLRHDRLEVVGTEQNGSFDFSGLKPLELGEGVVGRAARRGKAIRVDPDVLASMIAGEGIPNARSGLVVPLIVGARVVGTLACWARDPGLFSDEDERILSMMASQVATAVAAADTHETTRHEAHHDPLTGLPNRRQLEADIRLSFEPALAQGDPLAVAMIDVDHFKRFNDEFGHRVGDIALERVAEVLRTTLREGDWAYRYGGEEFAVVLRQVDPSEARHLLDRVRAAVSHAALVGENLEPIGSITISAGLATGPGDASGFNELLQLADLALYDAKRSGRNRVHAYRETENTRREAA